MLQMQTHIFHQKRTDAEWHFIPHLMLLSEKVLQGWKQTSAITSHFTRVQAKKEDVLHWTLHEHPPSLNKLTCDLIYFFLLKGYFFRANLTSYIRSHEASRESDPSERGKKGPWLRNAVDPQLSFQGQCLIKPDGQQSPPEEVTAWQWQAPVWAPCLFASEVKVDLWQTFWDFPDIWVWSKTTALKCLEFPIDETVFVFRIVFTLCFSFLVKKSYFWIKAKNRTNRLFLIILKTQPNYFLMLTLKTPSPSSPTLWDAAPVHAASQQHRAGQLLSSCILLPLWRKDSGIKFVVTALTSYRIHGFSIAWRIWTLRRRKPTRGTGSKVHVWSTSTGASQTPAWVEHPTYMPNATGFIVARKLRKQNCLALSVKWSLKDI